MMELSTKKKLITILVSSCAGCLLLGGLIGYGITYSKMKLPEDEQFIIDEYELLQEEWLFADEDSDYDAANGLASGMASAQGDSYTFLTPDMESQGLATDGKGLGINTRFYDGGLYVTEVHTDSTAEKQGVLSGDLIFRIDDTDFGSLSYEELSAYLSSLNDESHTFYIRRNGKEMTFLLKKDTYTRKILDILETPKEENGYSLTVRINTFLGNCALAMEGTINAYKDSIQKLIIDVRGNGGGYVSQACSLAKLFVKKDTLLYLFKDKDGKVLESAYQENDPEFDIPEYRIIQDGNSASASELFTLSMRAGTNCKVYGFTSYGKGIAQYTKTFSNGATLRYTRAYVYGPEKENETMYDEGSDSDNIMCINKKGIVPDVAYTDDYLFLSSQINYSDTYGISDYYMNFLNKAISYIRPELYKEFSVSHTFNDLIEEYALAVSVTYNKTIEPFNDDGTITKALNDKYLKESYDEYLNQYDKLTALVEAD